MQKIEDTKCYYCGGLYGKPHAEDCNSPEAKGYGDKQPEFCNDCKSTKLWVECWNCEDGYVTDDDPLNGSFERKCYICEGNGGYYRCYNCAPLQKGETL